MPIFRQVPRHHHAYYGRLRKRWKDLVVKFVHHYRLWALRFYETVVRLCIVPQALRLAAFLSDFDAMK